MFRTEPASTMAALSSCRRRVASTITPSRILTFINFLEVALNHWRRQSEFLIFLTHVSKRRHRHFDYLLNRSLGACVKVWTFGLQHQLKHAIRVMLDFLSHNFAV